MFTTRYGQEGNSTCLKSYKIHPVLKGKYMYRGICHSTVIHYLWLAFNLFCFFFFLLTSTNSNDSFGYSVWSTHSTQDRCYPTTTSFYPTFSNMYFNILANRNAGLRDETDTD